MAATATAAYRATVRRNLDRSRTSGTGNDHDTTAMRAGVGKQTLVDATYLAAAAGAPVVQRRAAAGTATRAQDAAPADRAPPGARMEALFGRPGGAPIAAPVRAQMERSFDADFSGVTVHEGAHVARLGADAYAQGNEIHMAPGKLDTGSEGGRALLGHELAHVVQQRQGRVTATPQHKGGAVVVDAALEAEADRAGADATRDQPVDAGLRGSRGGAPGAAPLQGKWLNFGNHVIPLYADVPDEYASDVTARRVLDEIRRTGATIAERDELEISRLDALSLHWLYNAMEVVRSVTLTSGSTLAAHYSKLYSSRTNPALLQAHDSGENHRFEQQVLAIIGWFKTAMTANAKPPEGETLKALTNTYNPPSPQNHDDAQPHGLLKEQEFRDKMSQAMATYLTEEHDKSTKAKRTNDVGTLAELADHIQEIAHACFAPFVGKTIASHDLAGFKYSQNVHDLETENIGDNVIEAYLHNRAAAVGTTRTQIWLETNFDGSNPQHLEVLKSILAEFAQHKPQLLEILRATPRNDDGIVHISRRVAPDADLFRLRWENLYMLCHEYMHTLAHPEFTAAAKRIGHPQIVAEGFPEALAYELKVSLLGAARRDPQFKALMEQGVPQDQPKEPPPPPLDYGAAATDAFNIIRTVGVLDARKAFFLGAVEFVGLAPEQKLGPEEAKTDGRPVRCVEHHKVFPSDPQVQERAFAEETQVKGFGEPVYDTRTEVDGVARVQVVRAYVQNSYRPLLAWMKTRHQEDTSASTDEDFGEYEAVRGLISRYWDEHWTLSSRVEQAADSPTRSDVLALLKRLGVYTAGFLRTHDSNGASTIKKSEWK